MTVTVEEAQARLASLLERVRLGEEVLIEEAEKGAVRLVCVEPPQATGKVQLGAFRGKILLRPGWDDPMTEEELRDWGV